MILRDVQKLTGIAISEGSIAELGTGLSAILQVMDCDEEGNGCVLSAQKHRHSVFLLELE